MQTLPNQNFRFGVLTAYAGHTLMEKRQESKYISSPSENIFFRCLLIADTLIPNTSAI